MLGEVHNQIPLTGYVQVSNNSNTVATASWSSCDMLKVYTSIVLPQCTHWTVIVLQLLCGVAIMFKFVFTWNAVSCGRIVISAPQCNASMKGPWGYSGAAAQQLQCSQSEEYGCVGAIEYRSYDVTKTFFGFHCFGYHVSVEHGEKHPQPKLGGNRFMGARDMAAWIPN